MQKQIEQKLDSREVAEMMEVQHKHLLEKIDGINKDFVAENVATKKYWEESTFENRGKQYRNYLITKRGCEFLAHKTTGTKGNLFTDKYMDRFEQMKEYIEDEVKTINNEKPSRLEEMETETKLNNSQTRKANSLMRMHKQCDDPKMKDYLFNKAIEALVGITPLPSKKLLTAEQVGKKLGISANMVGRIANANNLKTEEYGKEEIAPTKYDDKHVVATWRYYENVIPVLENIINKE